MEEIKITSVLTTIALILIGVLLFELIIFIHEFGHFITAKKPAPESGYLSAPGYSQRFFLLEKVKLNIH